MNPNDFHNALAFNLRSDDRLDRAQITGIFYPDDSGPTDTSIKQKWAHEQRKNLYLVFCPRSKKFLLCNEEEALYQVINSKSQLRLFTLDEAITEYFVMPHEDPDLTIHPYCLSVEKSRGLDGLYIREANCRHGRVSYFHSVYSYRIIWNSLNQNWELSTICDSDSFTIHAKSYHTSQTPVSKSWVRSTFLAENFSVKPYKLMNHVVGSTFVPAIPVLYFIDAWQRYRSDVSKDSEKMIQFTKISKIPSSFTKPIGTLEEIRIRVGLCTKDLKNLVTKECMLYSRLSKIVVDYVGDQSITLSIDNREIRQVSGGITVDQFHKMYQIDLKTLVKSICSRLNLHENVLKLVDLPRMCDLSDEF